MASKEASAVTTEVFLVELIVCGLLTLFLFFYFNRLFAALVSCGIRAWTWHKYRAHVSIEALQFSLLGGRIFFTGIRYVGNNESIVVHSGSITWCYWLRKCKEVGLNRWQESPANTHTSGFANGKSVGQSKTDDSAEQGSVPKSADLPCRLNITLNGAEWFIYNRSAAYDAVLAGLTDTVSQCASTAEKTEKDWDREDSSSRRSEAQKEGLGENTINHLKAQPPSASYNGLKEEHVLSDLNQTPSVPPNAKRSGNSEAPGTEDTAFILRFLPIHFECIKAAVVLGNEHTITVVVTKADRVSGEIDATRCSGMDKYRQLIELKFEHPVVQMKPNEHYNDVSSLSVPKKRCPQSNGVELRFQPILGNSQHHQPFRNLWYKTLSLLPHFRSSVEFFSPSVSEPIKSNNSKYFRWQGLSRYLDDNEQEQKPTWISIEYAAVSTIADSSQARLKFYWDVPGSVPEPVGAYPTCDEEASNINRQSPPEWGAEIFLKGALINYGPWADRQRAEIQRVFFPNLCRDAAPSQKLAPGSSRVPTQFKLYVEFDEETTFRIPIREESKNWKWTAHPESMAANPKDEKGTESRNRKRKADKQNHGTETRPFGWLDMKVASNATLRYTMDMVAGPRGFSNLVDLCLPYVEITTSVNHGLLLRASSNVITCDLSNPLQWNGLRSWKIDVCNNGLELFILREHVILFTDLIADWASGPPSEYLTFSPFRYLLSLHLADFQIYLNVNDSNIINNPSDFDDNTFLVIFGMMIRADITVPLDVLRPRRNTIPFNIWAEHGGINLRVPPWSTQATFLKSTELALSKALTIAGKYQYYATTSTSNTDTLLLDVNCHALFVRLYGFVLRYLVKVKDNYFGDDIRFKTLEEYQEVLHMSHSQRVHNHNTVPHKLSSDLDVILSVRTDQSRVNLPCNLYSAKKYVCVEVALLTADLRFTNYYMELDVCLSTLSLSHEGEEDSTPGPNCAASGTQLFIDGIDVAGNRLFGLPPTEPTYVGNWDFTVGAITGECTTDFLSRLVGSVRAFSFSFDDDENALPPVIENVLYDVTFLRISLNSIILWLHLEDTAFRFSTGLVSARFNDLSNAQYLKKLALKVPDLSLSCADSESASRHRSRPQNPVETHALVETSLLLTILQRNPAFENQRRFQHEHIQRHDQRTHRAVFLLRSDRLNEAPDDLFTVPAMSIPMMPVPLYEKNRKFIAQQALLPKGPSQDDYSNRETTPSWKAGVNLGNPVATIVPLAPAGASEALSTNQRSRSQQVGTGIRLGILGRDHSASTGRQSSFYSAFGERGVVLPNVTFSSVFSAPYFPLENVKPDNRDLPPMPKHVAEDIEPKFVLDDVDVNRVSKDSFHTSYVIELPIGLAGFMSPAAVRAVAELMSSIQPTTPVDTLDVLQINSIGELPALRKEKKAFQRVVDYRVQTPCVNVRFLHLWSDRASPYDASPTCAYDQYDVSSTGIDMALKLESADGAEETETAHNSFTLHLSLYSAAITVTERCIDIYQSQAAIKLKTDKCLLWLTITNAASAGLVFNCLEVTMASKKLIYLSALLHRSQALLTDFDDLFSNLAIAEKDREQLLTYLIATSRPPTADPLLFTRPSYVLRAATDHLRTSDSWKIVTRLRHMYNSLSMDTQQEIQARCFPNAENVPGDARQKVLACLDQWRSWDLNNIDSCVLIQHLYGPRHGSSAPGEDRFVALDFSLKTELVRIAVDQGPKQNEISIRRITTAFQQSATDGQLLSEARVTARTTRSQIFCGTISVALNWELYEVAEDILKHYSTSRATTIHSRNKHQPNRTDHWHVLFATQTASATIDTVNTRATSGCERFNVSVVANDDGEKSFDLICAAEAAISKTQSHGQELTSLELSYPSLCFSSRSRIIDGVSMELIKVAANSHELSLLVRQDIPALTEVVDAVLRDEVCQVLRFMHMVSTKRSRTTSDCIRADTSESVRRINVVLFLDMYQINMPVLQSLTYSVSGHVARASIAVQRESDMVFDFDIKENTHDIQADVGGKMRSITSLQIPPTNGRILSQLNNHDTKIGIFISVEPISLDATELHNLLSAFGQPEISGMLFDLQEDIKSMKRRAAEMFGQQHSPKPGPSQVRKTFVYDVHVTLAGFDVFADAKGSQAIDLARLDFSLGCIQLVLTNRLEQDGPTLAFPELRLSLRHVRVDISRGNRPPMQACGSLTFGAFVTATTKTNDVGREIPLFHLKSEGLNIELFAETALLVVDVVSHLQAKIADLDLSRESNYLRKLRRPRPQISADGRTFSSITLGSPTGADSMYSLDLLDVRVSWFVTNHHKASSLDFEDEDLVLSLKRINFSTSKTNFARLTIEELLLQMVPASQAEGRRSLNSALLPEVIFNVGYVTTTDARRLAFQAAGKSLDLRLTSHCIIPAAKLQKSISSTVDMVRSATGKLITPALGVSSERFRRPPFFGQKRMESLLVDADFAGAVVYLSGARSPGTASGKSPDDNASKPRQPGKYGLFTHIDASNNTTLRAPGLAWKIEYRDSGAAEPSLNAEVKVDASSNILYPAVVPLILEISSTIKEVLSQGGQEEKAVDKKTLQQGLMSADEDNILTADPSAVLGRTRLNLGLRICRQEFSLSCQPISRVAATAQFDDIYMTINTVRSPEDGHFFAVSTAFTKLKASVQHVYSRDSTGSFDVDSVFLSLMNSKHVNGISGISTILRISPMKVLVNGKQLQDFLLFREIWMPPELRQESRAPVQSTTTSQPQSFLVQRYQQVAATGAFPWSATVSIAELELRVDLGQAIGRSVFMISNLWISSKKNSDWEQNLCLGFDDVSMESAGRMSGLVTLRQFGIRTTIQWPNSEMVQSETPLVQGSLRFSQLRLKAAFDYQAFLVADITSVDFLMYNVRNGPNDRLVAILNGESVHIFCTTATASQALALFQAFNRLVQEKRTNYETSLKEIERFLNRYPLPHTRQSSPGNSSIKMTKDAMLPKSPISLHTDVIVTLKALNIGAFPLTFSDHQVFKLESLDAQTRFAVAMDMGKIHSILGVTLGQLRIGLAGVKKVDLPQAVGDLAVEDVVANATGSRGGTILKVPKVEATMETWQTPDSNHIDYIFKSSFEGKVEVGWNYSRIAYIRNMWASHTKALAQRLGKPLPPSAVKITGVPDEGSQTPDGEQAKITAEINVPQSRYDYNPLEPPIIETPQLRDMGEATPPLEWIGLHRDRLPNLTHQILIVTLLELATEVEDAYAKILGSS